MVSRAEGVFCDSYEWDIEEFNRWLDEYYGVQFISWDPENHISVIDEAKYLLFLLRFGTDEQSGSFV